MLVRIFFGPLLVLLVCACATPSADRGVADVAALSLAHGGPELPLNWDASLPVADSVAEREIGIAEEVHTALTRSPQLLTQYAQLGLAAADVFEAGRLSNPTLSVSVLRPDRGGESDQITFGLVQSFTDLLFVRPRSQLARGEFERAKLEVAAALLQFVRDVERAHYELVGAQQISVMRGSVAAAARTSAQLAQRFFDAGNISDLALSVELAAAAQADVEAVAAQLHVDEARSDLNTLMGLNATEANWRVTDRLPLPAEWEQDVGHMQELAMASRLDLAAARLQVPLSQRAHALARSYRWWGRAELGIETERETDGSRITGPTGSIELPIFNQNQAGVLRATTGIELARASLASLEIGIGNEVARAYARVQSARKLIELHRTALVPLRERVVARTQEQFNYMLIGAFDLIRAKQDEYDAYQSYLESIRDYWSARTDLSSAVGAALPFGSDQSNTVGPEIPAQAAQPQMNMHDGMAHPVDSPDDSTQGQPRPNTKSSGPPHGGMDMDASGEHHH